MRLKDHLIFIPLLFFIVWVSGIIHAYFKLITPLYQVSLIAALSLLIFFALGDFGNLKALALPLFVLTLVLRNPVPYIFLLLVLTYLLSKHTRILQTVIILAPLALVEGLGIALPLELVILVTLILFVFVARPSVHLEEDKTKNIQIKPVTKAILYLSLILILLSFSIIDPFAAQKGGTVAYDGYHGKLESAFFDNDSLTHSTLRYLGAVGYEPLVIEEPFTQDNLREVSILVMETPTEELTVAEIVAVTEFVKAGGGLFVLGDHTNIMNCYLTLNPVLHQFGLHLNFDYSMLWEPHFTSLAGIDSLEETAGATLKLNRMSALLFYSLRYTTWADLGDWNAEHHVYMGNVFPEDTEDHGVLPICAAVTYDKGKVVAIANSDSFSSANILYNDEFISRLMRYLNYENSFFKTIWFRILLLVFILFGFLRARSLALKPLVLALALVLLLVQVQALLPVTATPENAIALDVGHANVEGYASPHQYKNVFLVIFGQHYGFNPVVVTDVPRDLSSYKAYVTMGPMRPFSDKEVTSLREYVENGGFLVVCDGYHLETPANKGNDAANSLLKTFDITLQGKLLGEIGYFTNTSWNYTPAYWVENRIPATPLDHPLMQDLAGDITLHSAVAIRGGTPIALYNGTPVMVIQEVGNGQVLVIGDHTILREFVVYEPVFSFPDPDLKRFIENLLIVLGGSEQNGL
ncbi:MAG: hypothetical protein ACP5E9_09210 [Candidatus Methanospirareceae archaeon]